jgi:hypothetical protein
MAASELSVEALRAAIRTSNENGRLMNCLFSLQPDDPEDFTVGTPLHAACWDPDGQRGDTKIALLFEAANEVGLSLHLLLNARSIDADWTHHLGGDLAATHPFIHCL